MYDPDHLTGPEGHAQKQQVREKRCAVCVNRVHEGYAFGYPVLRCGIGLSWPKQPGKICRKFELDMSTEGLGEDNE